MMCEPDAPPSNGGTLIGFFAARPQQPPAKEEEHSMVKARMVTCESCHQCTHGPDRDDPSGNLLAWPKVEKLADGRKSPMGVECGNCGYARLRHWGSDVSQKQLNAMRAEKNTETDEKFAKYRADKASRTNQYRNVDVAGGKASVSAIDSTIDQSFDEGYFYELGVFARQRNLTNFPTRDALVTHIEQQMKYRCGMGRCGNCGVYFSNKPVGASYKYKAGNSTIKELRDTVEHSNVGAARTAYLCDSEHGSSGAYLACASPSRPSSSGVYGSTPSSAASVLVLQAPPSPTRSQAHGCIDFESPVACRNMDGEDDNSVLSGSACGTSVSARTCSQPENNKDTRDRKRPGRIGGGAEGLKQSAREVLDEIKTDFPMERLWNKPPRKRDYDGLQMRITSRSNKVAALHEDDDAALLSDTLSAQGAMLDATRLLFSSLKLDPMPVVEAPSLAEINKDSCQRGFSAPLTCAAASPLRLRWGSLAKARQMRWRLLLRLQTLRRPMH